MAYSQIPSNASLEVKPWKLRVSDEELDHFQQLLKLSRLAPLTYESNQNDTDIFGVSHKWMSETKKYWETQYDWRQREDYINSFPNFRTSVRDDKTNFTFDLHLAALFSTKPDAIPIVFLHGWPGSFLEFLGVLDVFRKKYPDPKDLPYHIIVPSLPGYALSNGPSTTQDFKTEDIARVIDQLMIGLGFGSGYVAQGGDIGSYTCRIISTFPTCKAIHLNFSMVEKPDSVAENSIDAVEKKGLERFEAFGLTRSAYAVEHGTRPATIGFALDASPVSTLAWIGEKFLTWTDETPSTEAILDSITLYWFTSSFPRCIFPYREYHGSLAGTYFIHQDPKYHIKQPFGYSFYPMEIAPMPKTWIATTGNLVWYKRHDQGGHFAAMEKPQLMVQDVEDFVKQVWKG